MVGGSPGGGDGKPGFERSCIQQVFVTRLPWAQGYIHRVSGGGQFGEKEWYLQESRNVNVRGIS